MNKTDTKNKFQPPNQYLPLDNQPLNKGSGNIDLENDMKKLALNSLSHIQPIKEENSPLLNKVYTMPVKKEEPVKIEEEKIKPKIVEIKEEPVKTKSHPCCSLGLDPQYIQEQENKLKRHEEKEKVISIKDSTFEQQYGKIHRNDKKDECWHCKGQHEYKIYSSQKTNEIVSLFQEQFLNSEEHKDKLETMVGAATISFKGEIVKAYVTHSGCAPESIKKIYNILKAQIIQYPPQKENELMIEPSLYAIHTNSALDIHEGTYKTIYGNELNTYNFNDKMKQVSKSNSKKTKTKELEKKNELLIELNKKVQKKIKKKNNLLEIINKKDNVTEEPSTKENIKEEPSTKENNTKEIIKYKIVSLGKEISNLKKEINKLDREIKLDEKKLEEQVELKEETNKSFKATYGTNFGSCAAQKLMQQISKDFGEKLKEKGYTINMSEAWVQLPSSDSKVLWSRIHPVHSCETCAFIIPNMLCKTGTEN